MRTRGRYPRSMSVNLPPCGTHDYVACRHGQHQPSRAAQLMSRERGMALLFVITPHSAPRYQSEEPKLIHGPQEVLFRMFEGEAIDTRMGIHHESPPCSCDSFRVCERSASPV